MTQTLKIEGTADSGAASMESPIRITIPVTGMTCAACQSFVQRTLADQAGVQDAIVNLMLHNATVTFDPAATSASALVEAIRRTGYDADIPAQHSSIVAEQAEHDEEQLREYKQLRLKAAISVGARCSSDDSVHAADEPRPDRRDGTNERSADELECAGA